MISKIISTNPAIMADEIQRLKEGLEGSVGALRSLTAKNLNLYPYRDTTKTTHGVTFTDVGDGTITASGTASDTDDAIFNCHSRMPGGISELTIPNGVYRISGCPSGGSSSTYRISVTTTKNSAFYSLAHDYGEGALFVADGDDSSTTSTTIAIRVDIIKKYAIADTLTFKPMLELVSLADPKEFATYSETNNQLTNDVNKLKCKETTAGNYSLKATVDAQGAITYSWEVIE